jgi:hypothetical protein
MAAEPASARDVTLRQVHGPRLSAHRRGVRGFGTTTSAGMAQGTSKRGCRHAPDEIVVLVSQAARPVIWCVAGVQAGAEVACLWGRPFQVLRRRRNNRATVTRREQFVCARGGSYLQVDASDASLPIWLKLGFRVVTNHPSSVGTPRTMAEGPVCRPASCTIYFRERSYPWTARSWSSSSVSADSR